jgi:hypothetical protein
VLRTLADLVGHDTENLSGGLTMGGYPGSAADAALIAAVKSVQPPSREQGRLTHIIGGEANQPALPEEETSRPEDGAVAA